MDIAWEFFSKLLGQPAPTRKQLNFEAPGYTPDTQLLAQLDDPFSEEEVLAAINDTKTDRAPGPDGFTGLFFPKLLASNQR